MNRIALVLALAALLAVFLGPWLYDKRPCVARLKAFRSSRRAGDQRYSSSTLRIPGPRAVVFAGGQASCCARRCSRGR